MKMRQMITRRVVLNAYRMFLSLRKRKRHLTEEENNNKSLLRLPQVTLYKIPLTSGPWALCCSCWSEDAVPHMSLLSCQGFCWSWGVAKGKGGIPALQISPVLCTLIPNQKRSHTERLSFLYDSLGPKLSSFDLVYWLLLLCRIGARLEDLCRSWWKRFSH